MANGAVQFKAFLRDENSVEARRFSIDDPSIAFSYICMKEKLQHIYPVLEEVIFKITWKGNYTHVGQHLNTNYFYKLITI